MLARCALPLSNDYVHGSLSSRRRCARTLSTAVFRTCHCAQNTAEVRPCAWPRGAGIVPGSALCLAVVHSASCAYALLLPANNFWLASAGLEAILCTCLALRLGALFHLQVDPTHICARPADFFLGELCIVETDSGLVGGNSLPEALFIAFEVMAGRAVPSAELARSVGQATIRAQIAQYMRTHMLEDVFRFYHGRLGGGRMRCFFRSFDTL